MEVHDVGIRAKSADGQVWLVMNSEQQGQGASQLSWEKATLALRALWSQVVMGFVPPRGFTEAPRFGGLSYRVEYESIKIW